MLNNNNWYAFNFDYLFLIFNLTGYSFISSLSKNYKLVTDVESGNNNNNDNNILLYSSLSLRGRRAKQTPTQIKDKDKQIQDTHSSSDINLSLVENSHRDGYLKRFKKLVINCSLFLKNNRNNVISIFVLCNIFVIFCFNISVSDLSILKSLFYVCVIIISFTFSLVISNIYNWSDNYFIRTVQKSIFYSILTLIGYLLLFYFGININSLFSLIHCDSDDENDDDGIDSEGKVMSVRKSIDEGLKVVDKAMDSVDKQEFVGNIGNYFMEFMNSWNNYIASLDIFQLGIIAHIISCVFILLSLLNIIIIIYSDFLITYLKIEDKFPKIGGYIRLRKKFQQFYLFINLMCIILTLFALLFLDLYSVSVFF